MKFITVLREARPNVTDNFLLNSEQGEGRPTLLGMPEYMFEMCPVEKVILSAL